MGYFLVSGRIGFQGDSMSKTGKTMGTSALAGLWAVLFLTAPMALEARPSHAAVAIPADHASIQYFGRFDRANPKRPRFDWPGCAIQARFTGPSIAVKLGGGNNEFNVFIDGAAKPRLSLVQGKNEYALADGLGPGEHTLLITKRTEGYYGTAVFEGLILADGHALAAPPPRPSRRILFVGDSFTVGYGADASTVECNDLRPWDNNWVAYGPVTARALDAEYSVQAFSGLGMVHNYGDTVWNSKEPLPVFFDRTLTGDAALKWDFPSWIPDLVVVALGTNDFSTAVKPTQAQYSSAYKDFLKRVRGHFPAAEILCLTYEVDAYQKRYVDALVQELSAAGDAKVHRVHMPALNQATELGCHWHPNAAGHKKYSEALIPEARKYLGGTRIKEKPGAPAKKKGSEGLGWMPWFRRPAEAGDEWADARGRMMEENR